MQEKRERWAKGIPRSEETKRKMSLTTKGRPPTAAQLLYWARMKDTPKTPAQLADYARRVGVVRGPLSNEHKDRIKDTKKKNPFVYSRELKVKMRAPRGGSSSYKESTLQSGVRWDETRARVLARDGFRCQFSGCQKIQTSATTHRMHVHHKKPWSRFRDYYKNNIDLYYADEWLISYCPLHHRWADMRLAKMSILEIEEEVFAEIPPNGIA